MKKLQTVLHSVSNLQINDLHDVLEKIYIDILMQLVEEQYLQGTQAAGLSLCNVKVSMFVIFIFLIIKCIQVCLLYFSYDYILIIK